MTLDETQYKSHCTVNVDSKLNLKGNALSYFSPYLVAFHFCQRSNAPDES